MQDEKNDAMVNMDVARDFIYLISCSVNEDKPDKDKCAAMDLDALFDIARRQSLTVAAALALEQVIPLPFAFKEEEFKAIRRLSLFNIARQKILDAFEQNGIWYAPLKGILLKELYPKTIMRDMADNDLLCDEKRMEDVKAVMEGLGFRCRSFGKYHDVYRNAAGTTFEIHRTLFDCNRNPDLYAYFLPIGQRLIKDADNDCGYHMSDEDLYVFSVSHIYKHYRNGGTGLRSLLDLYVLNRRYAASLDTGNVSAQLDSLGLAAFERSMTQLAQRLFGGKPLSESEQKELCFLLESDTHGTAEHSMMMQLGNDDSGAAKLKYAFHRVFPTQDSLKIDHPVVYRHKALYPALIVYRPIKGLLFHQKYLVGDIKRLIKFKKKENRGKFNE